MDFREIASAVLVIGGCVLILLGTVGLVRLPDVFARMHAATKVATLGLILLLGGVELNLSAPSVRTQLLLTVAFVLVGAPAAAHMVGRAAYRAGTELAPDTVMDELAERHAGEAAEQADPGRPGASGS